MIEPSSIRLAEVAELRALVGEYQFYLGGTLGPIRVKLWKGDRQGGQSLYSFTQSHHLHTPIQVAPYYASTPFGDTEEAALRQALSGFVTFYSAAVRAGCSPDRKWLITNESF